MEKRLPLKFFKFNWFTLDWKHVNSYYRARNKSELSEYCLANLNLLVLKSEEIEIKKETIEQIHRDLEREWIDNFERLDNSEELENEIDKEYTKLEQEIDSWVIEKNLKKRCICCNKQAKYWDRIWIIRSEKEWIVVYTELCTSCAKKSNDTTSVSTVYEQWRWFLTFWDVFWH